MIPNNFSMLCDFYEFTMGNGYFKSGFKDKICYFDMFFRNVPDKGGYAIACGLDSIIEYLLNLHFDDDDIAFLKSKNIFCDEFLDYLRNFEFTCDVFAVPEGTPVFPGEPLLTVRGPAIQAQLLETMVLLYINHQSLIATKASRIVSAAARRDVMEFGSRRAQGSEAAILGARAAYIAGCVGSACTIAEQLYGIPALGTMAHSWVQMFDTELASFEAYAETYSDNCVLLVDTYNVLKSGIPNAIKTFLKYKPKRMGIRIDSGDITYLSKKARKMLDEAGLQDCGIFASNSLDEYIIKEILAEGAEVDSFGVGERMITSKSDPVFGGVYKLVAVENDDGTINPKIKISENVQKITTPHYKKLYRLRENDTGKAIADLITVFDEVIDVRGELVIFDPEHTWKKKTVTNFSAQLLSVPIFIGGKLVYERPSVSEIRKYCIEEHEKLWDEVTRFDNPHKYYVDLSEKLWNIKQELLQQNY